MENEKQNPVTTTLNISNTDIITMLVVKNREELNAKQSEIFEEQKELLVQINKVIQTQFDKITNSKKVKDFISTLTSMLSYYIKIPYKITFGNIPARHFSYGFLSKEEYKSTSISIQLEPINEEDEDNFYDKVPSFMDDIYIPYNFTIKMPEKLIDLYNEKQAEYNNIRGLLANESIMKEKLIAKVTEKAIANSIELQTQLGLSDIKLLN